MIINSIPASSCQMQVPAPLPPSCVTLGNLLNFHVYSFSKIGMIIAHISWGCWVDYLGYGLLDDQEILAFMLIYIHICMCIVFQIFFQNGLLQNIDYYLCYAIGPCLYIFYIVVYIC